MREDEARDFQQFLIEFQAETDRGAALVGTALVDQKLRDVLRGAMVNEKAASRLLIGADAPLGTFSARTRAALAFGLISVQEGALINTIRQVRNEFAHTAHGTTFETPAVAALCRQLPFDMAGGLPGSPRDRFREAVIALLIALWYRGEWAAHDRRSMAPFLERHPIQTAETLKRQPWPPDEDVKGPVLVWGRAPSDREDEPERVILMQRNPGADRPDEPE